MTDNKQKSGVYEILNTTNGKRYVGSAVSLRKRKRDHWSVLRRDAHRNAHLQNAWNKYGEDAFAFEVLECWEPEFLVSMEQWWMNMLKPEYNIAPVAGSSLGVTHTHETRKNMSKAKKGRKFTPEHRANLSEANMGNTNATGGKGKKRVPMSEATKAKISRANKGKKKAPFSDSHKAKMSKAKKGKPWTSAQRAAYEARKREANKQPISTL